MSKNKFKNSHGALFITTYKRHHKKDRKEKQDQQIIMMLLISIGHWRELGSIIQENSWSSIEIKEM